MSIARHHAEWLSLVPTSGPFLSLPVLLEAFPQGLEAPQPGLPRLIRQEYAAWREATEKRRADPLPQRRWIEFVLKNVLDLEDRVLLAGQALPQSLQVEIPLHHEFLRPDFAVVDPVSKKPRLLVRTYPRGQDLAGPIAGSPWKASPETRLAELLRATGVRLGLVTNGEHWRLVDAPKDGTAGFASWYAYLWLEEPRTLAAFRSLLSAERFFGVPDNRTLEALFAASAANQQEVTDQLGYQVRRAVEVLIRSLDRADQDFGRKLLEDVPEEALYEAALTIMMRLVFLFCAEERELIPSKPFPIYEQNYSVSTIGKQLRESADAHGEELLERRHDAWPRLLAAFRAVYGGLRHDDVRIPAYGGNLFDPDRFPFLEGRAVDTSWRTAPARPLPVDNRTVLHLLEALQVLQIRVPGGGPAEARRLSFRALDIEQIGHVYEGLLDHTARRAAEPFLGLAGTRDKEPELPLAELERRRAASEADLLKYLKDLTGRSDSALKKSLNSPLDDRRAARFRAACQGDESLLRRVMPFAGLVRLDSFEVPTVIPPGSVFVTAGTDRRSSGTHYTPKTLTEPIVRYTLEPLVYLGPAEGLPEAEWTLKTPEELLDLKICDLACGSGAFLVQAARYLAEKLLEAWEAAAKGTPAVAPAGKPSAGSPDETLLPADPAERTTFALRAIAQRCLYGVDKNPLAVEMAKLSLWLLTLAKDKPFEFLDHAVRCGDSLVGLHDLEQLRHYSLRPDAADAVLFKGPLDGAVDEAIELRLRLVGLPAETVDDVARQESLLKAAHDKIARLRYAADLLVAAEFWGDGAKDKLERVRHAAVQSAHYVEQGPTADFARLAAQERRGQMMFHWPLEFPEVLVKKGGFDAFVGNPPFMGGKKITGAMGNAFRDFLVDCLAAGVRGNADLCAYFLLRANRTLRPGGQAGFLTTNTIAQGDTREVGLDRLAADGTTILRAISSRPWPGVASLEVSHLWLRRGAWAGPYVLNDVPTPSISPYLTAGESTLGNPFRLKANESKSFQGSIVLGMGFVLTPEEAAALIAKDARNRDVLFPYLNGEDLNSRPDQSPSRWVINFFDWPLDKAMTYPDCFRIIEERVMPERTRKKKDGDEYVLRYPLPQKWWIYADKRPELYRTISGMNRVLARSRVANINSWEFTSSQIVLSEATVIVASSAYSEFAILQNSIQSAWIVQYASSMRTDVRYTPTDCFETFPFPESSAGLEAIGERYHAHRQAIMVERKEGLTKTYNRFHNSAESSEDIAGLRELHVELDYEVAGAYGWGDLDLGHGFHTTKQGVRYTVSEAARRELLRRLLELNHARYAEEVAQGLHAKKGPAKRPPAGGKKSAGKSPPPPSTLFDLEEEG